MNSKSKIRISNTFMLIIIMSFFNTSVYCQNNNDNETEIAKKLLNDYNQKKEFCQQQPEIKAKIFPETYTKALSIRKDFCDGQIKSFDELQFRITDLYLDLKKLLPDSIPNKIWEVERKRVIDGQKISIPGLEDSPNLAFSYNESENVFEIKDQLLLKCDSISRNIDHNSNCSSALKEFLKLYNFAYGTLSQPLAWDLVEKLEIR